MPPHPTTAMSVFFAWCASFRKPPKLDQNGMDTKDDDEEEGVGLAAAAVVGSC